MEKQVYVRSEIPGPRSRELSQLRERYVARGVYSATPIFAKAGKGAMVEDVDGNRYLDFAGGIGTLNVGYSEPHVVEVVKEQVERYLHTCFSVLMYEPYVTLARRLTEITPGDFAKKALLLNSGAEAVENAVKIARHFSKKEAIIAFDGAFHGRTLLTMTLTGKVKPYKFGFGPFAPEIYRLPYCYCYRCSFGLDYPGCGLHCVEHIEKAFKTRVSPENVAALIVEPVQGEGGFVVPVPEYLRALKKICEENGILFIADE
ncbi:MAG TPA: aminotransferase class III-fold pyridoxal phosphate-dependent enzyme, partial [Anaerolineae bacterium]|nr:aminotransferase class III-fold pyridoxal phosphate-dependent enzyme [Anaerolineae bacterium]